MTAAIARMGNEAGATMKIDVFRYFDAIFLSRGAAVARAKELLESYRAWKLARLEGFVDALADAIVDDILRRQAQ